MNILIIDDAVDTCEFISQVITENFEHCTCQTAISYDCAIDLLSNTEFDVLILGCISDKSNLSKNGIDLGTFIDLIPEHRKVPVAFVTSSFNYIIKAVNSLNCVYCMIEPFYEADIICMMDKILSVTVPRTKLVFHDSVGVYMTINLSDIIYIQSVRHDIIVHTNTEEYVFTNYSLSDIVKDSSGKLMRCHKSYLVNPDYLYTIDRSNNYIQITCCDSAVNIPIGKTYAERIYKYCNPLVYKKELQNKYIKYYKYLKYQMFQKKQSLQPEILVVNSKKIFTVLIICLPFQ